MKYFMTMLALLIGIGALNAKVIELSAEAEFNQLAKSNGYAVVRVYADWCGPCKQSRPNFETVSQEFTDKVNCIAVNYDRFKQFASKLFVRSFPTWIYYKNGVEVLRHSGMANVQVLRKNIKQAFGL